MFKKTLIIIFILLEVSLVYSININEFFPNPVGEDDAPMPGGEFIELYNPTNQSIELEGIKIKDNANHGIIISDTNTLSGTIIEPNSYLAVYTNGFSGLLNNEGLEIIKLYDLNNTLLDEVSYSFSEEGLSWSKIKDVWQLRFPSPNEENKIEEPIYKSSINIRTIYLGTDKKAKFGDILRTRINIYKGNTSKESIKYYAATKDEKERITKETTVNLENKFTNYTLTLPMQLEPNCKQNLEDEKYKLIIEGLDAKPVSEEFEIEGITTSLCQKVKENITKEINYEVLSMPGTMNKDEPVSFELKLLNDENKKIEFEAWSYISKGSKIISGEEKDNLQKFDLPAGSSVVIDLENNLNEEVVSGEYETKIKLLKENRKRPIVIDSKINVEADNLISNDKPQEVNLGTGDVVYLASSQKAKNVSVYLFIALLLLITIISILKK